MAKKNISALEERLRKNAELYLRRYPKHTFFIPNLLKASEKLKKKDFPSSSIKTQKSYPSTLVDLDKVDVVYLYGLGLGRLYGFFKPFLAKERGRALVYLEDDEEQFVSFLLTPQAEKILLDPSVHIFFKLSGEEEDIFFDSSISNFFSGRIKVLSSPILTPKQEKKFDSVKNKILRCAAYFVASHVDDLYSYLNFSHFYKNIEKIPLSFNANLLKDKFSKVPAIICGAGPSLHRDVVKLKKVENRALIIAGGSAITALLSQGIKPHLGVVIDPNEEEVRRMEKAGMMDMPILYSTRVHSGVFKFFKGPLGYFSSTGQGLEGHFFEKKMGIKNDFFVGQNLTREAFSVTTTNLELARLFGCSPIILSGVDLAYDGNARYSPGVSDETNKIVVSESDPGESLFKKDGKVLTSIKWEMEASVISTYKKKQGIEIINTSDRGLEIDGVCSMSLAEAIKKYIPKSTEDVLSTLKKEAAISKMSISTQEIEKFKLEVKDSFIRSHKIISQIKEEVENGSSLGAKGLSILISVLKRDLKEEMAYKYFLIRPMRALERYVDSWYLPRRETFSEKQKLLLISDLWHNFYEVSSKYIEVLS